MKDASTLPDWPWALRREKAAAYLDMSPSTFDAAVKEGVIPPPVTLFRGVKAWRREALNAFLENCAAPAEAAAPPEETWAAP